MAALAPYLDGGRVEDDERKPRDPGCQCHWEEGDSPCPIHDAPASVTLSRSGRDEKLAECLRDVAADVPVQVLIDRLCEVQGYLRHGAADSVLLPRSTVEKVRCELEFVLKELRMSGSTLHALYADCVNIALDMLPKEKL